ncbi:Ankyrin repeat domain-containing protein [Balamuthia mandrillaris]
MEWVDLGHLEMLQWAKENGCPWDKLTCTWAAKEGHLKVLKWARENGCPWDEETYYVAEEYGHHEVVKWAKENASEEKKPE